jgi:deazaflavin-dependent oxidoreductase (nitroreductase family)
MAVVITPNGTRGSDTVANPLFKLMTRLNTGLYRLLRGAGMSRNMLLLTTTGAKTGRRYTLPLQYFPDDGDAWLIVASAGGAARHPAWVRNLAAHPDQVWIEIGSRRLRVRPESLQGEAREEAWRRIVARAAHFGRYQEHTDREIPVVRLTPAE